MRCMKVVLPLPAMPTQTIVTGGCAPAAAVVAVGSIVFSCDLVSGRGRRDWTIAYDSGKSDELLDDEKHH